MTHQEFRDALAALQLSQPGAATLFRANERTARRWATGEQDIPAAVSIALRLMVKHGERPADWIDRTTGHAGQ